MTPLRREMIAINQNDGTLYEEAQTVTNLCHGLCGNAIAKYQENPTGKTLYMCGASAQSPTKVVAELSPTGPGCNSFQNVIDGTPGTLMPDGQVILYPQT